MIAEARLHRARVVLASSALLSALGWAVAVSTTMLLLLGLLDRIVPLPLPLRQLGLFVAACAAGGIFVVVLGQNRGVGSLEDVALWLEARVPALRYALVTLREPRFVAAAPQLEAAVAQISWDDALRRTMVRALAPLALGAGLVTLLLVSPAATFTRIITPHRGDILGRTAPGRPVDPLHPLVVTITPPAYTGLMRTTLEDPQAVTGIAGSTLLVEGGTPGLGVAALLGTHPLDVTHDADRWHLTFAMPDTATPLWLSEGSRRELLVLDPRTDSIPLVELLTPVRDTVRRSVTGGVVLQARANDDFGLGEGWFEYIVSSGAGENFTFRSGILGRRALGPGRGAALRATLTLDALHLAPGNIVHLRAVVRDRNDVTGPGQGVSETRSIRIPRADEGDSVQIDPAAPAQGDSAILSQRMLIMLAEALERRRPRLIRDTVIVESRRIARDQASLRRRVADVLFLRLGGEVSAEEAGDTSGTAGLTPEALLRAAEQATAISGGEATDFSEDESPVVALNKPLLEAYNAMWDAGRALEIGEPGRALPPMRLALAAIQRARQAERLYLRGRPAPITVDLARIRLTGKRTDADPAPATGRPTDPRSSEALLSRFTRAVALLPSAAATDSLLLLRIDALDAAPPFAAALGEPLAALRAGRDATSSLLRARRLLLPLSSSSSDLTPWNLLP